MVKSGKEMVDICGSGMGGKTSMHGGTHCILGSDVVQMFESTETSPEPVPVPVPPPPLSPPPVETPPSGMSPLPAPESKSTLQIMVPPIHRSLARAILSWMVSASS